MMDLIKKLNQEVANFGVLYTKLHHFHWFVKGKEFYQLHKLFEGLYDEVTDYFDEVAERILMLDGKPYSRLNEFLKHATITEAIDDITTEEMIKEVIKDLTLIDNEIKDILNIADDVTNDILIGISKSFQKHVWMLKQLLL